MRTCWSSIGRKNQISSIGIEETLLGGQSFSWTADTENQWIGVIGESIVHLRLKQGQLAWHSTGVVPLSEKQLRHYLWLDQSYDKAVDSLPWRSDSVLRGAMQQFSGLRILRQPLDEVLLTFLLSSAKSIPQIKMLCQRINQLLGKKLSDDRYAFPGWEKLGQLSEEDGRALGLGYRAKYLFGVAQFLRQSPGWLEALSKLNYPSAKQALMELPGVGPKVADCVLLFGAGRSEAFPIDTWILQSLQKQYGMKEWKIEQMQDFAGIHFGKYAGLAQQFLFSFQRKQAIS